MTTGSIAPPAYNRDLLLTALIEVYTGPVARLAAAVDARDETAARASAEEVIRDTDRLMPLMEQAAKVIVELPPLLENLREKMDRCRALVARPPGSEAAEP